MSVTETLAREIAGTSYGDLPAEVIEVARDEVVLDGCANMLAGSQEPLSDLTAEYVRTLGGPAEASVVGRGTRTHPVSAAYANAVFCHSMDYELMWYPPTHPTSPSLPPLLALAEARGFGGADVLAALAVAFEVQGRLRVAEAETDFEVTHFHPPGRVGPFGAAAGAANLLDLTVEETRMALGIAGSRVSGLSANTGTMTKPTHSGNAARLGLESALLAERGFTGSDAIFEAGKGYNDVVFDGKLDPDRIVEGFGDPYRMVEPGLTLKKYPAQYPTHWSIDAALEVRRRRDLEPGGIESVEVEVGEDCESADRLRPETGLAGKFSIAYTVAAALLDGDVGIDTFRDDRRFAPDMEDMLDRIDVVKNPEIDHMDFAEAWSRVTVRTGGGEEYSARVDRPPGIWDDPLPHGAYLEKFRDCAGRVLDEEEVGELADLVGAFDTLGDLQPVTALLRGPANVG